MASEVLPQQQGRHQVTPQGRGVLRYIYSSNQFSFPANVFMQGLFKSSVDVLKLWFIPNAILKDWLSILTFESTDVVFPEA